MTEDNPFPPGLPTPLCIYDYIDGDGDLVSLDVVDTAYLAVSVMRRGRTAILTSIIDDAAEARKMAAQLNRWADEREQR